MIKLPEPQTIAQMLIEGRNAWIAHLLGCSRETVRHLRLRCGAASLDRGHARITKVEFSAHWRPVLAEQGLLRPALQPRRRVPGKVG